MGHTQAPRAAHTDAIRHGGAGRMDDTDIWRSAHLLIKQHGSGAELAAAGHIDAMIARGDPNGEAAWKSILRAIRELQRLAPRDREAVN